jgi:flagellar protein FlbT
MPSAWPFIEGINNHILNGDPYHALKETKKLISHEEKILESARNLQEPRAAVEADRQPA